MNFGFAQSDTDAEEGAFAVGADAQGDEDGAVEKLAVLADFFIAGIQDEIGKGGEGAGAPFLEFRVEELGALADLGGTDGRAAELFDDGGDFAGGDALDVHFCQREFEGLFGAAALFEGGGIKLQAAADLRDVEGDGAEAGGEGFVFEAVGVTRAGFGALVRLGVEGLGALRAHGLIDEEAEAFGEALGALFRDELQDGVQEIRIGAVGPVWFEVGCVCDTPTGNPSDPPSTSFSRTEQLHPSGVRLRSARYARLRSASPRRGEAGAKKDKLQKEFYTDKFPATYAKDLEDFIRRQHCHETIYERGDDELELE
jgi:hypothetical protein